SHRLVRKAVEVQRLCAYMCVNVDNRAALRVASQLVDRASGGEDFVPNATNVHDERAVGLLVDDSTCQSTDHESCLDSTEPSRAKLAALASSATNYDDVRRSFGAPGVDRGLWGVGLRRRRLRRLGERDASPDGAQLQSAGAVRAYCAALELI